MKEIDMAINTWRIVFIVVPTLEAKKFRILSCYFSYKKAKVHLWNKLQLYRKAPVSTQIFSIKY